MPELALLRFVVLDDDYIGDDFIGQYTIAFECLQPGYRNVPLLGLAGDPLPHASLFVHIAITNRRGGGKAQRRGLSVRRGARRGREYVTLRNTGIKVLDDSFRPASGPLREATDLREDPLVREVVRVQTTVILAIWLLHYLAATPCWKDQVTHVGISILVQVGLCRLVRFGAGQPAWFFPCDAGWSR